MLSTVGPQQARTMPALWISSLILMVFLILIVGGITRLTQSGLSIVEWRPIAGIVAPLNETQWQEEFAKYQNFPEYKLNNSHFTLQDFKFIYFWEYLHRLLGRLIGFVFLIPGIFFWRTQRFSKSTMKRLSVAFVLGGCQGLMGWYMVKSGLVDRPDVSHFRLAAHLLLALMIMSQLFWTLLTYLLPETQDRHPKRWWAVGFLVLVVVQITWGALTAGLDAGFFFNTFPKMGPQWVPDQIFELAPWWDNFINNRAGIQFFHRWLGILLFVAEFGLWFYLKRGNLTKRQVIGNQLLLLALVGQFIMGVMTLIFAVPIPVAVVHQAGAVVVLMMNLFLVHALFHQSSDIALPG